MSSHHFVREEQATALYIKERHIEESVLMQLLEWNPVVIANGNVLEWLYSLNIKLDIIVSDGVSPMDIPYDFKQWENAATENVLLKIKKEVKAARIIIIGDNDIESIHGLMLQYADQNYALYESDKKHFVLKKGAIFKKWVNKGFLFALANKESGIVEGKVKELDSNYMALEDGIVTIHSLNNLIIIETL